MRGTDEGDRFVGSRCVACLVGERDRIRAGCEARELITEGAGVVVLRHHRGGQGRGRAADVVRHDRSTVDVDRVDAVAVDQRAVHAPREAGPAAEGVGHGQRGVAGVAGGVMCRNRDRVRPQRERDARNIPGGRTAGAAACGACGVAPGDACHADIVRCGAGQCYGGASRGIAAGGGRRADRNRRCGQIGRVVLRRGRRRLNGLRGTGNEAESTN